GEQAVLQDQCRAEEARQAPDRLATAGPVSRLRRSVLKDATPQAANENCMIECRELTKRFPLAGGGELLAVDGVSFAVRPGEVYGLLGPNGAGKTTTIRMILGLLRPTSGEATIAGYSSATQPDEVKRRVGLIS